MLSRSLRHRAPVLWLVLPFAGGLAVAHVAGCATRPVGWLAGAALVLAAALFLSQRPLCWGALLTCGGLLAGIGYYALRRDRLPAWDALPPREVQAVIEVERLFARRAGSRTDGGLARIVRAPPIAADLAGQPIAFSLPLVPAFPRPARGEHLEVVGVLEPLPRTASPSSFDGYLANAGVNYRLARGRMLTRVQTPGVYQSFCDAARARLSRILELGISHRPDLLAVLRGMVLGETAELRPDQETLFLRSGTMHLFSISGLHIAAIAVALHMLVGLLRLPAPVRSLLTVAALWLYVDITGTSPSAVRAFVMVMVFEAALTLERPINPLSTLATAALVTLAVEPMQLFGASFQMSYGIVAGLLLLGLPLGEWLQEMTRPFRHRPRVLWTRMHHGLAWFQRALASGVAIGLATSLVSTVATVLYFKMATPAALLANLVLVPLSSFALWAGFLSLLCGLMRADALAIVFNHAGALVLVVMEAAIRVFVVLPAAYAEGAFTSPTAGYVTFAGLLILLGAGYCWRWEWRAGGVLPPFLWLAAALVWWVRW